MLYKFTDNQVKNLKLFLSRVDLKGSEAPVLVDIIICLNNPVENNKEEVNKSDEGQESKTE